MLEFELAKHYIGDFFSNCRPEQSLCGDQVLRTMYPWILALPWRPGVSLGRATPARNLRRQGYAGQEAMAGTQESGVRGHGGTWDAGRRWGVGG